MSSTRGPGVIGTLMALAVLGGFTMLYLFAFDESLMGGNQSIKSLSHQQSQEIDSYHYQIKEGEYILSNKLPLILAANDLAQLKNENESLQKRRAESENKIESARLDIANKDEVFETYKNQYRNYVRNKAKGEKVAIADLRSGTNYKDASILEVTAIGIQIRHENGIKRIPFEELPESMRDYYQFDPKQKALALEKEQSARNEHEADISYTFNEASKEAVRRNDAKNVSVKEKLTHDITEKKVEIARLLKSNQWPSESQLRLLPRDAFASTDDVKLKMQVINALQTQLQWMQNSLNQVPR